MVILLDKHDKNRLISKLRNGADVERMAKEYQLTVEEVKEVDRNLIKHNNTAIKNIIKNDIDNGMTYREAEKKYNVPRSTLWSWFHG